MKQLFLDKDNKYFLDFATLNTAGKNVSVTIVGEDGTTLLDSAGGSIEDKTATFDVTATKYYINTTFKVGIAEQYARAFWFCDTVEIPDTYSPEEVSLLSSQLNATVLPQIMPVNIFIDNFIGLMAAADATLKNNMLAFITGRKAEVERELLAAQGNLELDLELKFFKSTDHLDRDFYSQDFSSEFWLQQANYVPIIEVTKYQLIYGNKPIVITDNIADQMVVDKNDGTIRFVPTSMSGTLFTAVINMISGLGISILSQSGFSNVPCLFRIDYTHGLDFTNLAAQEKATIRQAVGRNALIKLLPRIDPKARKTGFSRSIDGASKSESTGIQRLIADMRTEEAEWVKTMKRRYGTHFRIAIA